MNAPEAAPEGDDGQSRRKSNVRILLGFLAVFLLLIIVFRSVLFPFLMAMFIAYLVEPLVAWFTRSRLFGIRWTRGPVIVLVYVIVLGGIFFGAWKGLTKAATLIRDTSKDIATEIKKEAPRAVFELQGETLPTQAVVIPKGMPVRLPAPTEWLHYETLYEIRIEPGARIASSLLQRSEPAPEAPQPALADGSALPGVVTLDVRAGTPARGLEYWLERELITPIEENLRKADINIEPTSLRAFIAVKAAAISEDLPEKLSAGAVKLAGKVAFSVYEFFIILMLTAFIVTDRKGIARFFASLPPPRYKDAYHKLMRYIDDGLAGVIRGQLVICGVNGILTYIGLLLIGIPGAFLLSLIAAVLSLIPIFGTIVSSVPMVLIGLTDGVDTAIWVLAWIVFIHMLEANLLNPIIMGSHARMHPVVIVFALLAGEHSFGIWGALLAVPTASIIQACFRFYLYEIEGLPEPPPDSHGHGGLGKLWGKLMAKFKKPAAQGADG